MSEPYELIEVIVHSAEYQDPTIPTDDEREQKWREINLPAKDDVEPKDIKIIEKPKVKKNVFKTINFLFFSAILSKEVPDIYEI